MKTHSIAELAKEIQRGTVSITENAHKIIEEAKKQNKKYHHFCLISEKEAIQQAGQLEKKVKQNPTSYKKALLLGVPVSAKDAICVKGIESRAGSQILSGYKPLFDATVIERAKENGAIIIGKTSQDEFGFGAYNVNAGKGFEIPKNPFDKNHSTGGSSGGSAGFTSLTNFSHVSLAESTGGSAACPASFCGCTSITPTYGRISRNGLIDFANSLDKISPMGKTMQDAAFLLKAVAGADAKDSTTANQPVEDFPSFVGKSIKGMKIGIIKEFETKGITEPVQKAFQNSVKELESQRATIEKVSLPLNSEYSIPTYYLLATSEASTNLAKYCGMRYGKTETLQGNFNEYFSKVRSNNFGEEAKRRLLLGTFARMSGFRDAYYLRALKVRQKLIEEFQSTFKKVDLLVAPTMNAIAPTFKEVKSWTPLQHYYADRMVNPPNVAGLPHSSVNIGAHKGMPIGMLLMTNHWQETKLVQAGSAIEKPVRGVE
ncbi:aspartyl/glutamyl-tRNA amidotransferase subunit A [Candidatus Micrarchaeota archaeon]|nr:aspartyl/glutamyl-tRNA amidotransferase subunit A [Candidatus Micrarchaeota archaeon]MBU1930679.1 aspartyl/glutamyl-tRNA amidotransferase subunit A [Candidatus Micrarchaeota archaeon]